MKEILYSIWDEVLSELTSGTGNILLLGGTDTGKTTFVNQIINRFIQTGQSSAIIDADLGQSEIGPPCCVALGYPNNEVKALSEIKPERLVFVGNTTPVDNLLELVTGIQRLAAIGNGRRLVVDTGGYIQGFGAQRLIRSTCDLLTPDHIVLLQRDNEMHAISKLLKSRSIWKIHQPGVPDCIGGKARNYRIQRRVLKFAAYFSDASMHSFDLDDIALVGGWLGNGEPLPSNLFAFVRNNLQSEGQLYYAELQGRSLYLLTDKAVSLESPRMAAVQQELGVQSLTVTVISRLKNLLLGLEAGNGRLLGMGILGNIDFRRRSLEIVTPVRRPELTSRIIAGRLRITTNGKELGQTGPDEW